jgi:nitrate reductase gamma subunit
MSTFYALLLLAATAVMIIGLARKARQYRATPAPLKIPVTPAPKSVGGVVYRMAKEVLLFASLFRSNKWIWMFGYLFHVGLALAFIRHLRYVISPDNLLWPLISLEIVQSFGKYAGIFMILGLAGLLARRILVARVRYISAPSDYLMLILIMVIGMSGLVMSFIPAAYIDIVQLKSFMMGITSITGFEINELPVSGPLLVHLGLVAVLGFVLPISKLLHIPGVFYSPTRNQIDNPREKRHIVEWAKELDEKRGTYPEFNKKDES